MERTLQSDQTRRRPLQTLIPFLAVLFFTFLFITDAPFKNAVILHSETFIYEDSSYYADGEWVDSDD